MRTHPWNIWEYNTPSKSYCAQAKGLRPLAAILQNQYRYQLNICSATLLGEDLKKNAACMHCIMLINCIEQ